MNPVDLQPLFKKLGHKLEEIRLRALNNIISKLDHGVICDADIVQEKHLLIRLLEWFNFSDNKKYEDVMKLLTRLSKHTSAAAILRDVGAVEFLSVMRKDCSPSLHAYIDQVLENLFLLPEADYIQTSRECVYVGTPAPGFAHESEALSRSSQAGFIHSSVTDEIYSGQELPSAGYFSHYEKEEQGISHTLISGSDIKPTCFRFSSFPWVALTPTDRHVLSSTDHSLRSNDSVMVASACEFLRDVVFQDFPAEVFLQRPNIVKSLLSLLCVPVTENTDITLQATKTLSDLSNCVKARIALYQDPALYSPKQDLGQLSLTNDSPGGSTSAASLDTRPSVIGISDTRRQGDGQDGDSSSGSRRASAFSPFHPDDSAIENTDVENSTALQFHQLSVPQFCLSVLRSALLCMKTDVVSNVHQVSLLVDVTLHLLEESVTQALWEDSSAAAREMMEKMVECFEIFAEILEFHHHSNTQINIDDAAKHRVVFIMTAVYLTQMLKHFVPVAKARSVVPESLTHMLGVLLLDENIAYSYPSIRWDLIGYVQALDGSTFQTYQTALAVSQAMHNTCKFLKDVENQKRELWPVLVSLAEDAIVSLPYHTHLGLVQHYVMLCSHICSSCKDVTDIVQRCRKVLLKFLSHPLAEVRIQAYATSCSIIKEAIGVKSATNPQSEDHKAALFILDRQILYDVTCFGLADTNDRISQLAEEVMLHLLQGQLLMPQDMWRHLLDNLAAIMPVLQGFSSLQTPLGNCIVRLVEVESHSEAATVLPPLERFRGVLRLLFHPQSRVRCEALSRLAWFLSHEEDSINKLPVFSQLDVKNLTNIFIKDHPASLEDFDTGKSIFQVEGMMKVFDIVVSPNVEVGVRKSAVEQLSIILQDKSLHPAFVLQSGLDSILDLLRKAITKPSEGKEDEASLSSFIPACLCIMKYLLHHDSALRHKLAHTADLYYTIIRGVLLHVGDERCRYEAGHILTLLLNDEVATFTAGPSESCTGPPASRLSLPHILSKRFQLPFTACSYHTTSPHCVTLPLTPDPLLTGPPAEMLKVAWQVAWHDGIELLIKDNKKLIQNMDDCPYSRRLLMSSLDQLLLRTSHLKTGLQDCMDDISNATSHDSAICGVQMLISYLLCGLWHDSVGLLHSMPWIDAMKRFLKIIPSSTADERLLYDISTLITLVLEHSTQTPPEVLNLLGGLLNNIKGPLITSISRGTPSPEDLPENVIDVKRKLSKAVMTLTSTYVNRLPYTLIQRKYAECVRGDLSHAVLLRLNLADAAHFYNLSSLESTLACLMHITARRGWSRSCSAMDGATLCSQMLQSLLEVVFAFHVGRGGISMSYMGKGVTRCATLCLQHLAYEMAHFSENKDWPKNWLFSKSGVQSEAAEHAPNLMWLIPLWAYRDPEVRSAGLGVAVALASTESGRLLLNAHCQQIPGSIWGVALSILLDQAECSLVRQQAALLLVNLTAQSMPNGSQPIQQSVWQGPAVHNPDTQVSLCGVPALLALLHHSHFYQEMMTLVANFYPQPAIHPVSVANQSAMTTPVPSEATLTTSGSAGRSVTQQNASNPTMYTSTPSTSRHASISEPHNKSADHNCSSSSAASQLSQVLDCSQALSSINEGQPRASTPREPQEPRHTPATATSATTTSHSVSGAGSELSVTSGGGVQYHSVTTPSLMSAVCRLLSNLLSQAPEDTLNSLHRDATLKALTSMINSQLVEQYLHKIQPSCGTTHLGLSNLLHLYNDCLHFLSKVVSHDASVRGQLLKDELFLTQVVVLLGFRNRDDSDLSGDLVNLHKAVFMTLTSLLHHSGQSALSAVTPVLTHYWSIVSDAVCSSMTPGSGHVDGCELSRTAQTFIAVLLTEEGKQRSLTDDKDAAPAVSISSVLNAKTEDGSSYGATLCEVLVKAYDQIPITTGPAVHPSKQVVVCALKALLAVSSTAKNSALTVGLMESLTEQIKNLHIKLNMDALQLGKVTSKKKEDPLITDLIMTLDLIQNFIYQNYDAKVAAVECSLASLVHKFWSWCQMHTSLMLSVLALLSTFTARCPPAASSLTLSTGALSSSVKPQHGTNSLLHCLIKLAQREMERDLSSVAKACMSLLTTLSLCAECRSIMWKSNFLTQFSNLSPSKSKKSRSRNLRESLWLDLLVNLSFSSEGQTMLLKIDNLVELLLEFGASQSQHVRPVTLILRNLSFHASNKPKLLTYDKLLPHLMVTMETGDDELRAMVLSGLWALLHNNQKAKVAMKNANLVRRLHNVYNTWILGNADAVDIEKAQQYLQSIIQTLAE